MADHTDIEWTDATWNPITGCSVVSPGCTNCYAMRLAGTRLAHHESRAGLTHDTKAGPVWTGEVRLNEQWLDQPIRWRRPRRIFICAHGDLFHENVPDEWIDRMFAVMAQARWHVFQVLTKRAARMQTYLTAFRRSPPPDGFVTRGGEEAASGPYRGPVFTPDRWPLPHVWLGVSVEDQKRADERIPHLLATPAAVRWISAEPLLGPIDLGLTKGVHHHPNNDQNNPAVGAIVHAARTAMGLPTIDWVVAGGESGPGARPMHPDWARGLRDQCAAAAVSFFFKQWGGWGLEDPTRRATTYVLANDGTLYRETDLAYPDGPRLGNAIRARHHRAALHTIYPVGKKAAGRLLDDVEHNGMPGDVA